MFLKKENRFKFILIFLLSAILTVWNPLGFDLKQALLVGSLMIAVASWATDAVHKSLVCLFLLGSFLILGQTPALEIVSFLWGDMNLMIITTTFLSIGLMKTGLIQRLVAGFFQSYATNPLMLLILPYLLAVPLTLLIPQAFVRVIILGTILDGLLTARNAGQESAKSVLLFNAFLAVTMVYMLFSNGDIVLNLSVLTMAGEAIASQLTFLPWLKLMGLPVAVTALVSLGLVFFLFRQELAQFSPEMVGRSSQQDSMPGSKQGLALGTMLAVVLLWSLGSWHGLPAWLIALIGVLVLFAGGILDWSDRTAVNPHFILFLMIIFSIGRVLGQAGVTAIVFDHLQAAIPSAQSPLYLLIILLVFMLLHLAIGSVVATISVTLPIILPLLEVAGYPGTWVVLMIYVLGNTHFLLPFHHASILIGSGKKYYPDTYLLRYGAVMTLVVPLLLLTVYLTWWRFIG